MAFLSIFTLHHLTHFQHKHSDLHSVPGTFQILPCTRTLAHAVSFAWNMTALAFDVPAVLQDLVQVIPLQMLLECPTYSRAHIHSVTHDLVHLF